MLLFTGQILSFPCERDAENDHLTQTEIETESAALNNVSPQLCCSAACYVCGGNIIHMFYGF